MNDHHALNRLLAAVVLLAFAVGMVCGIVLTFVGMEYAK